MLNSTACEVNSKITCNSFISKDSAFNTYYVQVEIGSVKYQICGNAPEYSLKVIVGHEKFKYIHQNKSIDFLLGEIEAISLVSY